MNGKLKTRILISVASIAIVVPVVGYVAIGFFYGGNHENVGVMGAWFGALAILSIVTAIASFISAVISRSGTRTLSIFGVVVSIVVAGYAYFAYGLSRIAG